MMLASTIVPGSHPVAPLRQVRVDLLEQTTPQPVPLQQVPKVQNRRLVRQRTRQTQPREPPHRLNLVQHVLHPRVAQVVEQLHAVNPQQRRQRVRLPPPARLRIQRPNPRLQTLPRNQRLHPLQKQLPPRPPLLPLVLHIRERHLLHRPPPRSSRSALELPPRKSNVPGTDLFRVFLGEESSSYFNWTTLYRATNGYDYGVWRRTVFDQLRDLAPSDPAIRALGLMEYDVRMVDRLMEVRCAGQAMIDRASALRFSDGTVIREEAPPGEIGYAVPGTFGADMVGAICAGGRRLFP